MIDPTTQQIGVGGAVAVLLVSAVLKFLPAFLSAMKRNGNGKAAGLTAQEWRAEIEAGAERALIKGAAQRHADLERLMERVMEREFGKRDKVVRDIIREELRQR